MNERIHLHTDWRLTWAEFTPDEEPDPRHGAPDIPASVPGDVHLDLMREGILPDLYYADNLDHAAWVEHKDWWYRTRFRTPDDLAGRRALLVFHGLDTYATVWLNGQTLARTDNMHLRYEFDVTGLLRPAGANELIVRLSAPMHAIAPDFRHGRGEWSPERIHARKAQMSFGWDIAPRLMTVGIWRPVELLLLQTARIVDVHVSCPDPTGPEVAVDLAIEVEWLEGRPGRARLSGAVHDAAWEVQADFAPGRNTVRHQVVLRDPPLWWPVGYGPAGLCEVVVRLERDGRSLDEHRTRIGPRRLELVQEAQPSGGRSFRFRCNGRDVFVTGLNWTPLDAIFARVTPERITRVLEALAGVGCNMLRVWGGGIYESQHFYSECDRLGIMVWQDFMMACAWYPQTDALAARLEAEARQVVRDLRNHPCLALWCGDNEVDVFNPAQAGGNRLTRQVLAGVCRELDPGRPYIPSTPYSPSGGDPQDPTEGTRHWYAHGQSYREPVTWNTRCRFMAEFGHLSLPSVELMRRYLPPGTEWPLTSAMWRFHGADTHRVPRFRGSDRILQALAANGLPAPGTIEEAVTASQELQAQAICAWVRRYAEDLEFGGFLLWNVCDCWPQHSDSVLEYGEKPKAVFRRLKALFEEVRRQRPGSGAR